MRTCKVSFGSWRRLTIKNWAGKEHQELDEHVLLLARELVPSHALPSSFDIAVADALLDVDVEPFWRYNALVVCTNVIFFLAAPEL